MASESNSTGLHIRPEIVELMAGKQLTPQEVILLSVVDGLVSPSRGCYASNSYLAERLGTDKTRISRLISDLSNKGWIINIGFDGRVRYLETVWSKIDIAQVKSKWLKRRLAVLRKELRNHQGRVVKSSRGDCDIINSYENTKIDNKEREESSGDDGVTASVEAVEEKKIEVKGFPIDIDTNRKEGFADRKAKALHNALAEKRKLMRKVDISKWATVIKRFINESGIAEDEFGTVLDWYMQRIGDQYIPRAYSATAFCERFVDIADAMEREDPRDGGEGDGANEPDLRTRAVKMSDEQYNELVLRQDREELGMSEEEYAEYRAEWEREYGEPYYPVRYKR